MNLRDFWMPHSHCVLNDPAILLVDTLGNALTALSYVLIPLVLWRTTMRLWNLLEPSERHLFLHGAAFIVCCSFTHVMKIWNWWHTLYGVEALAELTTGIVSITFCWRLYRYSKERLSQARDQTS